jgi:hypothetical protein
VTPQWGAKDQLNCTVYYIASNSNCKAQGVSNNLKQIVDHISHYVLKALNKNQNRVLRKN